MVFIKVYHTLGGQYLIHDKEFPMGTVVLKMDNGIELFCKNFNIPRSEKMLVTVYNPIKNKWIRCKMKNEYTEIMWDYYKKKVKPKRKHKKRFTRRKEKKHGTQPVKIPESVRWAMQHPYQGGGVSPR